MAARHLVSPHALWLRNGALEAAGRDIAVVIDAVATITQIIVIGGEEATLCIVLRTEDAAFIGKDCHYVIIRFDDVYFWCDIHYDELMSNWNRLTQCEAPVKIEPLK